MLRHEAVGFNVKATPDITINLNLKWTETSIWETLPFILDEPTPALETILLGY